MEVSDQLFTQLSTCEEADEDEDYMEAIEIITGTDWWDLNICAFIYNVYWHAVYRAESLDQVKEERDKLYALLKVPKPVLVRK